jgi:hypothetical protein
MKPRLDGFRRQLAGMSDAALARTYEIYRMACGLRTDGVPRLATMQRFWQVWEECRRRLEPPGRTNPLDERYPTV